MDEPMTADGRDGTAPDPSALPPVDRCEERRETNWIAVIRLADGTEIPTTVKDVSPSGARLAVPRACALPDRFMFKVVGRDFVCAVRLAWRRGDHAGVRIERVGKLGADARPAEAQAPQAADPHRPRARRADISRF